MAVLLYYPLVNPPAEVLHQSLLYWDGIASVVPADPQIRASAVSQRLKELEQEQLYTPVTLDQYALPSFHEAAGAALVEREQDGAILSEELRRLAAGPRPPRPTSPPDAFLYLTKVHRWLEERLLGLRLATRCPDDRWRLAVAREVQELIVGVAVREIAQDSKLPLFPYTDCEDVQRRALRPAARSRALAWEMELGRLLPVPAPDTPLADILAFREQYGEERVRLMRAIHRMLGDLRRDYEHPADVLAQLRVELEQALADYRSAARDSRMTWVHRSVTVTVALAAAAGGAIVLPDLSWFLGVVGGYALNAATREIRPVLQRHGSHDFSYLHRIHTDLS
ncbi:DUF6236 family protein [Streptomyces sp. NPDC058572]|uniref:DUF6236 family protein n=1 Tax=Streptomyces sp. NPDC058572 TaxID=3346546 RepID=UPI00365F193E